MLRPINRRSFGVLVGSGLVASASTSLFARRSRAAETITVLNWQGYGTDEAWALKEFSAKSGISVKHDYYNSEPELVTKLRTNPGIYDVVLINSARTQQVAVEGMIDPIDYAKVPNAKDLTPTLKGHPNLLFKEKPFGVAWVWGMNSLAVRRDKVANPDSFSLFGNPDYADRVALFDDSATEIAIGALLTGQDINDPKDLKAIGEKLKSFKKNVKLLWSSEDEWNKAFAAGAFDISVYWSGAAVRSQRRLKLPVDFVVPKEGAIGWLDGLSIPSTSTKKEAAYAFINYMIDPQFYVEWATKTGAPASANTVAMNGLPADDLNRKIYKPEYLTKLQFMSAMPDDRRTAFADLWQETKAFYAK
jgi:spermidine/putrescine transport system substrate-binding protein